MVTIEEEERGSFIHFLILSNQDSIGFVRCSKEQAPLMRECLKLFTQTFNEPAERESPRIISGKSS